MSGRDITVRNLAFDHAADQDHNSAGILAHGENPTVERSSFIVNENDLPRLTAFAGKRGGDAGRLSGNRLHGHVQPSVGPGPFSP